MQNPLQQLMPWDHSFNLKFLNPYWGWELGITARVVCGFFLMDRGIEALGPGEKMPDSARFQSGSNLEMVWRSIPCPNGLSKPKPELFTQMIRNESKNFVKTKVCVQHIGPLVSFEGN